MTANNSDFWENIPYFKWTPSDDVYFDWKFWLTGGRNYRTNYRWSNFQTNESFSRNSYSDTCYSFVCKMNDKNRLTWIFRLKSNRNKLSFYLLLQSAKRQPVKARYKVCLANHCEEEFFSKEGENTFDVEKNRMEQQNRKGFDKFIAFGQMNSYLKKGFFYVADGIPDIEWRCYIAIEPPFQRQNKIINIPKCALLTDLENLLLDQEFSDIVLCAKGKEFRAHKAILAQRSSVFKVMFQSDMTEKAQNKVVIQDVEPDVMNVVLKYIYTGDVNFNSSSVVNVLHAAEKYNLHRLKTACENRLVEVLNVKSAVNLLNMADKYNASQLKAAAVDFISEFPEEVSRTTQWDTMLNTRPDLIKLCLNAVFAERKSK